MAELIELEGPAQWEFHLLDILGWMASDEEPQIVNAACEVLCAIFSHTDNRLASICPKLLPVLYQIFTLPDVIFSLLLNPLLNPFSSLNKSERKF